jgi:hypothetical protein
LRVSPGATVTLFGTLRLGFPGEGKEEEIGTEVGTWRCCCEVRVIAIFVHISGLDNMVNKHIMLNTKK